MSQELPVLLIVDDVATNVQTLAQIFKEEYHLKIATNGMRALELAEMEPMPDLILLDVAMPDMSGYDVCRLLKEKRSTEEIPVIFVTGRDTVEDEEYGFALGAVDYIVKPVRPVIAKARVKTHITIKRQRDMLEEIAIRDQLTGLYNRHMLTEELERKVSYARRHHEPLSLIMVDLDHFKAVNDTFGHLAGDGVLQGVANILIHNARREDTAARFGGEEMVLLMDKCEAANAFAKAEKMRLEIEALHPEGINVTASFGIAELTPEMKTGQDLMKKADDALYRAKEEGRNRVVLASEG